MTFRYFGYLLWEAFRRGQLLSLVTRLLLMTFHYFGRLREAFRREQLLSNRIAFDDFSLLSRGYFRKPSVGDSCLVTGPPLITFHYFWGVLWKAFHRGQLLSDWVSFNHFSLLWGATLESLPSGTAAE